MLYNAAIHTTEQHTMQASKTYAVNFAVVAAGNGYWGMKAGTEVTFNSITLSVTGDEDGYSAELRAEHNCDAGVYGLCYTDSAVEDAVEAFALQHAELGKLVASADGSEQGMQDDDMLSCDAVLRDSVDVDMLQALGFDVYDEDE